MSDYLPGQDAKFNDWQNNFFGVAEAGKENLGVGEDDFNRLSGLRDRWNDAYAVAGNRHNRTEADVTAKNEARAAYKKELRVFVKRYLSFNAGLTDADRDRMGLTVPSGARRTPQPPATAPVAEVDFSTRLRHLIHFRDSAAAGRKKPAGTHGCEIWSKAGGSAPVNESELAYLGVDTASPYTVTYAGDRQGQTAWYWLRWVNTRGQHGPWSAPVSAVIA